MNEIYNWLYDHYCAPLLEEMYAAPGDYGMEPTAHLEKALRDASGTPLDRTDWLNTLHIIWGTEAFAVGVQLGVRLMGQTACPQ